MKHSNHTRPDGGPLFQTLFTITGIKRVPPDGYDRPLYTLYTKEGSEVLTGRKSDGSVAVHVSGPVGDSGGEYGGPEAEEVLAYAEAAWKERGPADEQSEFGFTVIAEGGTMHVVDQAPTLESLYAALECETIDVIDMGTGMLMIVDDNGRERPENKAATDLLFEVTGREVLPLHGAVAIVRASEFGSPDETVELADDFRTVVLGHDDTADTVPAPPPVEEQP